jgi:hypothetical protein
MSRENKRKEVRYSELNRLTVAISAVSEKKCECGSIVREDFFSFFSLFLPFSFNVIVLFISRRTYRKKEKKKKKKNR